MFVFCVLLEVGSPGRGIASLHRLSPDTKERGPIPLPRRANIIEGAKTTLCGSGDAVQIVLAHPGNGPDRVHNRTSRPSK